MGDIVGNFYADYEEETYVNPVGFDCEPEFDDSEDLEDNWDED